MAGNGRLLLFYSDHCPHCTQVIGTLDNYGLRHLFLLVDLARHPRPPQVDRVPFVMDVERRRTFTDDDIYRLLQTLAAREDHRIQAYHGTAAGFSDGFMEIGDSAEASHRTACGPGFTGLDVNMSIDMPPDAFSEFGAGGAGASADGGATRVPNRRLPCQSGRKVGDSGGGDVSIDSIISRREMELASPCNGPQSTPQRMG